MDSEITALFASLGIIFGVLFLVLIIFLIPLFIAQWKLFKKAGKKGWEIFIPFYSKWVLMEIAGLNWWYFLISIGSSFLTLVLGDSAMFIAYIFSYYINFIIYYNIAKKMNQNPVLYGVLGVFIPYIVVLILGFSNTITYDKDIEVKPNAIF